MLTNLRHRLGSRSCRPTGQHLRQQAEGRRQHLPPGFSQFLTSLDQLNSLSCLRPLLTLILMPLRHRTQQYLQSRLQLIHPALQPNFTNLRLVIQSRCRQLLLLTNHTQQILLQCLLSHEDINIDGTFLTHPVRSGYSLLQYRRIPRQIHIDHCIGRLQIQPRAAGIRRQKDPTLWIVLKLVDNVLPPRLRNLPLQPHKLNLTLLQQRLNQIQHPRPLRKHHRLVIAVHKQRFKQFIQSRQLAGIPRTDLVNQNRTVRRHATHQQRLPQSQQIHL